MADPSLAKLLKEIAEPIHMKFNTEVDDPSRPNERSERELPTCIASITLSLATDPICVKPVTDKLEPSLAKERIEKADPR
jgi:hypothetical protein